MNEGFPVMVQKTLPVCLDRAWHLLASERGFKNLVSTDGSIRKNPSGLNELVARVREKKRLSYISFWVSGPDIQPSLVNIRFIPRMRHTTVKLTQVSIHSKQNQQLFTSFWQKRMEAVV